MDYWFDNNYGKVEIFFCIDEYWLNIEKFCDLFMRVFLFCIFIVWVIMIEGGRSMLISELMWKSISMDVLMSDGSDMKEFGRGNKDLSFLSMRLL